jgi:prefoldin subunit 5
LQDEVKQIDDRIRHINREIRILDEEKDALQRRKEECHKQLKGLMPSSSGGNKKDSLADWNSNGILKTIQLK